MKTRQKRRRKQRILKQTLKAKSKELDELLNRTGPNGKGWQRERVQTLIRDIGLLEKAIANSTKSRRQVALSRVEPWQRNRNLRELNEKLARRFGASKLHCPKCGDSDHGNRMNNKPWCVKCSVELVRTPKKCDEPTIRVLRRKHFLPLESQLTRN